MRLSNTVAVAGAVLFIAAGGFGASAILGATKQTPQRTVTVNVATGPQGPAGPTGPAGPQGPPGPAGSTSCPSGFKEGLLVINHPGGQTTILTCIKD